MTYPNEINGNKNEIKEKIRKFHELEPQAKDSIFTYKNVLASEGDKSPNRKIKNDSDKQDPIRIDLVNHKFSLSGCLTSIILVILIIFAFIYFLTTQFPSVKEKVDSFISSNISPTLEQKFQGINLDLPFLKKDSSNISNEYLSSFISKVANATNSNDQVIVLTLTEDEINSFISSKDIKVRNYKTETILKIFPEKIDAEIEVKDIISGHAYIGTNSLGKFRIDGGKIATIDLSIKDFRDKVGKLPLGIGNYDFEKIHEDIETLLFDGKWNIDRVVLKNKEMDVSITRRSSI